ncbi:PREDICTED: protein LAZ1 homolog 1 [Camelina sativa]|uniref:Protein LAZ1 homolog 1 n=1 Tax=Camelina sativa TaxID=90675 RepID=A0ABM1Q9H5_CAMSA|nr:PREDICTED: protein LAZ1 homolog 1 [Camelina sativa]
MEWRGILCSLLFIFSVGESSSRFGIMWQSTNIVVDSGQYFTWPILSASVFVVIAIILPMYLIFEHLASYNQPEEQKFLIGLILMVPVYAVESFLSLVNSEAAFNCEVIRDCYEAFALYCFERYLIACLDGEERTIEFMEQQTVITQSTPLLEGTCSYGVVEHPFPMNCFVKDWSLGPQFYHAVKIGIVQYMILKMICALLAMILEAFGVYGEGKFAWNYGYPYLAVVLNFSQTWALYCLVQFYNVIKDKLAPIKPLAKFLTFKSIVFLTWWQGIIVAFLFSMGLFKGSLAKELKTRIQDYIICIEMGIAAVVHLYVFPAAPYKRGERCVRNVAVMSDYASLDVPPDPEEVKDSERTTRTRYGRHEIEKRLNFPQSVRDVVLGSGEIIVDDMRFTVSHVVEPVERGIAKINRTFHQISENVKRFEQQKKTTKDDSYVIPLNPWTKEFSEIHENLHDGGSVSDSGLGSTKRHHQSRVSGLWTRMRR